MTDEGEDRDSGFDDLFEDLDKFFAPEEKPEGRRRRGEGVRESPAAGGTGPDRTGDAPDAGSPAPSEDEILSGDWFDVEGLDLGEPAEAPASASAAPSEPPAPAAPAGEPPAAEAEEAPPERTVPAEERLEATAGAGADRSGGPTAEMRQQDW